MDERALEWGHRYAMVDPSQFRIDYAINPFMDPTHQPDHARTVQQWEHLVAALRDAGAKVDVIPARADSPDMVYAMNLGLVVLRPEWSGPGRQSVVMSHMRYEQRRHETVSAEAWFQGHGYAASYIGRGGVGPHFEAGDAFPWQGELVVGYGPRTEELALKAVAADLGVQVRGLRITHPGMYHLDLAFCPLDERRAIVCPDALDRPSAEALLALVPEPLVITEQEAIETFCANSVVIGRTVVMPGCPDHVRARLEAWGFEVVVVDVSEFHLGGGSVRCLTNPLDITRGRDLEPVLGGRVLLPEVDEEPAA
jgi:N-dimethylarginine dimethylaminohydrolase